MKPSNGSGYARNESATGGEADTAGPYPSRGGRAASVGEGAFGGSRSRSRGRVGLLLLMLIQKFSPGGPIVGNSIYQRVLSHGAKLQSQIPNRQKIAWGVRARNLVEAERSFAQELANQAAIGRSRRSRSHYRDAHGDREAIQQGGQTPKARPIACEISSD